MIQVGIRENDCDIVTWHTSGGTGCLQTLFRLLVKVGSVSVKDNRLVILFGSNEIVYRWTIVNTSLVLLINKYLFTTNSVYIFSGGYYTIEQKEHKLRIIALNTNLFTSPQDMNDPMGQWNWLEDLLAKSQRLKETVRSANLSNYKN